MMERDFLSMDDLTVGELNMLLERAAALKADPAASGALAGRAVALIFEKPSTRTRVSFEVGVTQLGGQPVVLSAAEMQLGRGETIEDTGRVLSRYVDLIVVRTSGHDRLQRLAAAASVPVVNALSDDEHPCQVLADLLTLRERLGPLAGRRLAYVGDGNNVAHSLLLGGALAGMAVRVAAPSGYEPAPRVVKRAGEIGAETGGSVALTVDAREAVAGASAVYTDVWASMGQEAEAEERRVVFAPYQVDTALLEGAAPEAVVLHCLPAHRGEEISDEVLEGPRSAVWDQAENRLHAQKALLEWLAGGAA